MTTIDIRRCQISKTYTKAAFRSDLVEIGGHLRSGQLGKAQTVYDKVCRKINRLNYEHRLCDIEQHQGKIDYSLLGKTITLLSMGSILSTYFFPGICGAVAGLALGTAIYKKTKPNLHIFPEFFGSESVAVGTVGAALGTTLFGTSALITGVITGVAYKCLSLYSTLG